MAVLWRGDSALRVHAFIRVCGGIWYEEGDSGAWQWGKGTLMKRKADIRGHKTCPSQRVHICTTKILQIRIYRSLVLFCSSLTCPPRRYVQKAVCSSRPVTIDIIMTYFTDDAAWSNLVGCVMFGTVRKYNLLPSASYAYRNACRAALPAPT